MAMKKGDPRVQAGQFDQPCLFYTVVQTSDAAGGEIRTPLAADIDGATPAYRAWANVSPYQGQELLDAKKIIGEIWSVISIRYAKSRVPAEGMLIKVKLSGEVFEIRGVLHLDTNRRKIELTCRLIR